MFEPETILSSSLWFNLESPSEKSFSALLLISVFLIDVARTCDNPPINHCQDLVKCHGKHYEGECKKGDH
jgi:hypothetical protein